MENRFLDIGGLKFERYLTSDQIEANIELLAKRINHDYGALDQPLVMLITLSGAMMFASELSKRLTVDVQWAFIKCSSYGECMCSSADVKIVVEPTVSLNGRDVLVVEDIVDTGNTWVAMHPYLMSFEPRSLKIATLMLKKEVYNKPLPLDYVGMEVETSFLVGYGLDYNECGRNLNGIYRKYGE